MLCTNCNASLLHDDVFCGDCGTPVARQASVAPAAGGMSCSRCGQPVSLDDTFCGDCGTPVTQQTSAPPMTGGMSCSKCSLPMAMDDLFCGDCGTPFTPPQMAQTAPVFTQPAYQPPPAYQPAPAMPPPSVSVVKFPLLFVIDTSSYAASYLGELNKEMNSFKASMSVDSQTNTSLEVAIIQFGERYGLVQNFTSVQNMNTVGFASSPVPNVLYDPPIREALRLVVDYTRNQKQVHKPWVIMICGSSPGDDVSSVASEIKSAHGFEALRFIALGVDRCDFVNLNRLTDVVFRQDGISFASFFDWLCGCVRAMSQTPLGQKPQLPNLTGNVYNDK